MDEDKKKRIADYFDPGDLVEFIGLTTEEVVEAFQEDIMCWIEDIEEIMGVSHGAD